MEGKCLYIDTCGTFRPEKLLAIADRFGLEKVLNNIMYAQAYNIDHQTHLLNQAIRLFSENHFALIIIDTVCGLYKTDSASCKKHIGRFLISLNAIMREYGLMDVVITNQVAGTDADDVGVTPMGENLLARSCKTRLYIRKKLSGAGDGDTRICLVHSSPCLPKAEAMFVIAPDGIKDVEGHGEE